MENKMMITNISSYKKMPRIYLAGPTVFEENPNGIFEKMKEICFEYNIEGVSPLDNQIGLENFLSGNDLAKMIAKADFDLMDKLDGGIFCLDPFRRSTEMDPGTAVEIGYMKAQKKPLAGWTIDSRLYPEKVRDFYAKTGEVLVETQANSQGGTSGTFRDPDGILVHSDGMVQNAMTQGAIELSGGKVCVDKNWEVAFKQAVISLKEQFIERDLLKAQEKIQPLYL